LVGRLLEYSITILIIVTLNFFLPRLMPGDPFLYLSSEEGMEAALFSQEHREYYMQHYGLDRPVMEQYVSYLRKLLSGDMGYSIYYNEPVAAIVFERLKWSVFLMVEALVLSHVFGVVLGSISAWYRGKWVDRFLYFKLVMLSEIPDFLLAIFMLFVLAGELDLFPISGALTHFAGFANPWERLLDIAYHAILPLTALTVTRLGETYLLARNSMVTVMTKRFMDTARAKGLSGRRIIFRHALKNSILPVITRACIQFGSLAGGTILVENVFAYPGLGLLMREAIFARDYPLIQGAFLAVTAGVLLMNLLADLIYPFFDPRIGGNKKAAWRESK